MYKCRIAIFRCRCRHRRTGSLCILRLASTRASCPSSLSVFAAKNTPLREILALFCPQTHFKKITVETNVRIISLSLSRVCLEGHFCPQKHPSKRDFSLFSASNRLCHLTFPGPTRSSDLQCLLAGSIIVGRGDLWWPGGNLSALTGRWNGFCAAKPTLIF